MQITFYSEDNPQGLTADWPTVPREGDLIEISLANGTSLLKVDSVKFHMNVDGNFHSIDVHLIY